MKSLGQIAYEAFIAKIYELDEAKQPVIGLWLEKLPFEMIASDLTSAWEAVGDAVTAALLKKPAEFAQ